MQDSESPVRSDADIQEVARQAKVELAILLQVEKSLRIALQWMTRDRGNNHKLSTLRFHVSAYQQYLTRVQTLADESGYMHLTTKIQPHLASDVDALRSEIATLHKRLDGIVLRLDRVSSDDASSFRRICVDLERFLDDLKAHGQRECELLQHSFNQEEGGSG